MTGYNVLLASVILTAVAIILSSIGVFYYYSGHRKFLEGDFKSHATWMFYGVIAYTIHLFAHLVYQANEIEWISVSEDISTLVLYVFLIIAGIFFLVGSVMYLKLADRLGFKR